MKKSTPCIRALKTKRTAAIFEEGTMSMTTFAGLQDLYFGGDMEASVGLAGQTAGLIDSIKSAKDIIDETIAEFHAITKQMAKMSVALNFG